MKKFLSLLLLLVFILSACSKQLEQKSKNTAVIPDGWRQIVLDVDIVKCTIVKDEDCCFYFDESSTGETSLVSFALPNDFQITGTGNEWSNGEKTFFISCVLDMDSEEYFNYADEMGKAPMAYKRISLSSGFDECSITPGFDFEGDKSRFETDEHTHFVYIPYKGKVLCFILREDLPNNMEPSEETIELVQTIANSFDA